MTVLCVPYSLDSVGMRTRRRHEGDDDFLGFRPGSPRPESDLTALCVPYRGASLIRNRHQGGGRFLVSEVPLYSLDDGGMQTRGGDEGDDEVFGFRPAPP